MPRDMNHSGSFSQWFLDSYIISSEMNCSAGKAFSLHFLLCLFVFVQFLSSSLNVLCVGPRPETLFFICTALQLP